MQFLLDLSCRGTTANLTFSGSGLPQTLSSPLFVLNLSCSFAIDGDHDCHLFSDANECVVDVDEVSMDYYEVCEKHIFSFFVPVTAHRAKFQISVRRFFVLNCFATVRAYR